MRHDALGQKRHDAMRAKLGRFFHDYSEHFSLRHGLQERDLKWQGSNRMNARHAQGDFARRHAGHFTKKLPARAIEHGDALTVSGAKNFAGMMRLAFGQ